MPYGVNYRITLTMLPKGVYEISTEQKRVAYASKWRSPKYLLALGDDITSTFEMVEPQFGWHGITATVRVAAWIEKYPRKPVVYSELAQLSVM